MAQVLTLGTPALQEWKSFYFQILSFLPLKTAKTLSHVQPSEIRLKITTNRKLQPHKAAIFILPIINHLPNGCGKSRKQLQWAILSNPRKKPGGRNTGWNLLLKRCTWLPWQQRLYQSSMTFSHKRNTGRNQRLDFALLQDGAERCIVHCTLTTGL